MGLGRFVDVAVDGPGSLLVELVDDDGVAGAAVLGSELVPATLSASSCWQSDSIRGGLTSFVVRVTLAGVEAPEAIGASGLALGERWLTMRIPRESLESTCRGSAQR